MREEARKRVIELQGKCKMTLNTLAVRKDNECRETVELGRKEMLTMMAKKVAEEKNQQYGLR